MQAQGIPDTGWTAITAAKTQESVFGKPVEEYMTIFLPIAYSPNPSHLIGLGGIQLEQLPRSCPQFHYTTPLSKRQGPNSQMARIDDRRLTLPKRRRDTLLT